MKSVRDIQGLEFVGKMGHVINYHKEQNWMYEERISTVYGDGKWKTLEFQEFKWIWQL